MLGLSTYGKFRAENIYKVYGFTKRIMLSFIAMKSYEKAVKFMWNLTFIYLLLFRNNGVTRTEKYDYNNLVKF